MRVRDIQQILGKFTNNEKGTIISDCPIYIETLDGRLEEIRKIELQESVLINWLIGINVLSFLLIGINTDSFMQRTVQELIDYGGLAKDTFDTWELWRLITSQFIHLDLRHLLFNMYILF